MKVDKDLIDEWHRTLFSLPFCGTQRSRVLAPA